MTKSPSLQPQDKYVLRLPDGMRDRLKAAAEANNRSMNAEIIARLELSFQSEMLALHESNLSDLYKIVEDIVGYIDEETRSTKWRRENDSFPKPMLLDNDD